MVDFRYHLVSIIAVFLALTVGIVVGTTALNGPVLDGLKTSVASLTGDKRSLEGNVLDLRRQSAAQDDFTRLVAPAVLKHVLDNRRVLVMSTPDAPDDVRTNLLAAVRTAGATVTGDVRMRPALVEPTGSATVADVVAATAPAALDLSAGTPADKAATELAAALATASGGLSSAAAQSVVAGFTGAGLLDVAGRSVGGSATLVLVVTGPPKVDGGTDARNAAVLSFLKAFDAPSGVVVAGPAASADSGAVLSALRGSSLDGRVSSVDDADGPQGVVAAVLALAEQFDGGAGSYGTGRGASAAAPQLVSR